ncbi:MAG: tRNA (N6-isopentenyl adenosine(37)-C2)-methylthiotransferase MiaB [Gammaproteobacteria bacterium]|nr:tRNA (N6-isopentenyl adenosine(37)-C2)-methylthiotransferase MiaB [Gammaproteobacteria bacterium]
MGPKLYIKTFGCQMNEYDSARMADVLAESHGLELTSRPEEADVLLLNTCSVRDKAQEKVFSELGRWREWKGERPGRILGVGGCVASQEGAAIHQRTPYVDLIFGPQTLHRLPQMLEAARARSNAPVVDISFPEIEKFDRLPEPTVSGPGVFVSIMEGCSKYCTFCVVPYTRGEEVSRPFEDVLAEVALHAGRGAREVTLLGQNVNAYRGPMADGTEADLGLLIHYVAAIAGIERIRFTTSHPLEFDAGLIQAFAEVPALADHVHLPVQSGSDRILALMKRGHTALEYRSIVRRLRAARPGISISSDFIVGFPGETEADFEATMALIEAVRFDHSYSFVYSPRPGTPAAAYADDVPPAVKQARLRRLQDRIGEFAAEYRAAMVGSVQRVLVEGRSRRSERQLAGKTSNNNTVHFTGPGDLIGGMADVLITADAGSSLRGELAAPRARAQGQTAANWI